MFEFSGATALQFAAGYAASDGVPVGQVPQRRARRHQDRAPAGRHHLHVRQEHLATAI